MRDLTALLVDLDGTLVDTGEANFAAYSAALSEAGIAVNRETFDRVAFGRHWQQFLPVLLEGTAAEPATIAARKQMLYVDMLSCTRLNHQLVALISVLRPTCKTGLVSSASRSSVIAILGAHDLQACFDVVVTGDDVVAHKPAPEAYLLAAHRLSVDPGNCLAIEDSAVGVESARRAGMAVLRIESAFF